MNKILSLEDIMTVNPVTVSPDSSIDHVIQTLDENGFDHLPVVDQDNKVVGIISKSDLYKKLLSLSRTSSGKTFSKKALKKTRAEEIMTPDPVVVRRDQSVEYTMELLLQDHFHAVPVVDNHKLVGIVTSKDLLEYMFDNKIIQY